MDRLITSLAQKYDSWLPTNKNIDRETFDDAVKQIFSKLPPELSEKLLHNAFYINELWTKVKEEQQKKEAQTNVEVITEDVIEFETKISHYFSKCDIDKDLSQNPSNKKSILLSNEIEASHFGDTFNPFFRSYQSITFEELNNSLDILLKSKKSNLQNPLSLIQFRWSQNYHSFNTDQQHQLQQKFFHLLCENLTLIIKSDVNEASAIFLNQLLTFLSHNDIESNDFELPRDFGHNILKFIRTFLEYLREKKIENPLVCSQILSHLLKIFLQSFPIHNVNENIQSWTITQRLLFFWTIFELYQDDYINRTLYFDLIKWCESKWLCHHLHVLFESVPSSFSKFTDAFFKVNSEWLKLSLQDKNEQASKSNKIEAKGMSFDENESEDESEEEEDKTNKYNQAKQRLLNTNKNNNDVDDMNILNDEFNDLLEDIKILQDEQLFSLDSKGENSNEIDFLENDEEQLYSIEPEQIAQNGSNVEDIINTFVSDDVENNDHSELPPTKRHKKNT